MTSKELRDEARVLWNRGTAFQGESYQREADAWALDGDAVRAEFYASLAACYRDEDGAQERKERAWAALKAKHEQELAA